MTFESGAADWFERQRTGATLSDVHRRCLHVLAQICWHPGSLHNLPSPVLPSDAINLEGWGISALISGELATFDGSGLTRLVVAAHRHYVRVAVKPWLAHLDRERASIVASHLTREHGIAYEYDDPTVAAGVMEVTLHVRKPDGPNYERHPGLEDLTPASDAVVDLFWHWVADQYQIDSEWGSGSGAGIDEEAQERAAALGVDWNKGRAPKGHR